MRRIGALVDRSLVRYHAWVRTLSFALLVVTGVASAFAGEYERGGILIGVGAVLYLWSREATPSRPR